MIGEEEEEEDHPDKMNNDLYNTERFSMHRTGERGTVFLTCLL